MTDYENWKLKKNVSEQRVDKNLGTSLLFCIIILMRIFKRPMNTSWHGYPKGKKTAELEKMNVERGFELKELAHHI